MARNLPRSPHVVTSLALFISLVGPGGPPARDRAVARFARLHVALWTDRAEAPYTSGEAVRVFFRTDHDAYVTILRVDTDGRVRVLFPREPWEDTFARGGRDHAVPGGPDPTAFFVDDYPGVGYLLAVSAPNPFVYDAIASGDQWDYRAIADGRVRGDPYVALKAVAQRIVPAGSSDWDYDLVSYYVQQHYDYPRFLCYDCHSYASYPFWNPYDHTCPRFRIVMLDDPSYYPERHYGGAPVVFSRPLRPGPRFLVKDRRGEEAFLTHLRIRPSGDATPAPRPRLQGVAGEAAGPPELARPTLDRPEPPGAARPSWAEGRNRPARVERASGVVAPEQARRGPPPSGRSDRSTERSTPTRQASRAVAPPRPAPKR